MDINGTVLINEVDRFQYKVSFFKLSNDSFLFDNFEELFEKDALSDMNQSISEGRWILDEDRNLLPEQTGCLVFCVNNFQDVILLKCETFVTFTVLHELQTHKLQLYGGSVIVDRQFLVESESNDMLSKSSMKAHEFFYQQILTIAVSSITTQWSILWKDTSHYEEPLEEFLVNFLKYHKLNLGSSDCEVMEVDGPQNSGSVFLYSDSGFLKHSLIRFKTDSDIQTSITIYSRTKQQPLLIRDSILKDYKHTCEIVPGLLPPGSAHEAIRSLLDEIAICGKMHNKGSDMLDLLKLKLLKEVYTDDRFNKILQK